METQNNDAEKEPTAGGRNSTIIFLLVTLVFVLARLWRLTASCLWFDEIFSVHAARQGWSNLVKFAAADIIHPPLFYAVLKVWITIGGESLLWLRLLPFVIDVASILPFWLLCRELKLTRTETNFALLLIAVSGFLIKYTQEVRMYSLLLFLSVSSFCFFLRFLKAEKTSKKELIVLGAINLLLVYTHYYGWLVIAIHVALVLFWQRKKPASLLLQTAALLFAYCPWIYAVAVSREPGKGLKQNLGWIARPGIRDVAEYFVLVAKPFVFSQSTAERAYDWLTGWLVVILFGAPLLVFLWQVFMQRLNPEKRESWHCLVTFAFVPVAAALVLSWVLPFSIWGTRHLIIGAVPFLILAAVAILRLRPYWVKITVSLVLGCWILLAGAVLVITPAPLFTWCAWEELVRQMPPQENNSTTEVYAFEDLVAYHLWFAATKTDRDRFKVTAIKSVMPEDPAFFLPRRFDEIKVSDRSQITGERIWLAFRAPRWDETRPPLSIVKASGYQSGRVLTTTAQGEQAFLVEFSLPAPAR